MCKALVSVSNNWRWVYNVAVRNFEWKVLWRLAVLTVCKGVSCKFGKSVWQLLQVSRRIRDWVYPRDVGRLRIVSPELQWICHVTTLLFWFCETVGWTAMGRRRRQRAAHRLRWLPSEVRCAICEGKVDETGIYAVCSWLGYQIASPLRRGTERSRGVVYLLSGGRASYVGVTSFRQPGGPGAKCKLSGVCPRYWEHVQDLRKNPNDHQAAARNKRRCFSCIDEAKIAVLELSRGDMVLLRVVEKRLISSMCPDANTQHRTEFSSLRSGRLRTCVRRRPPKRFRPVPLQSVCVGGPRIFAMHAAMIPQGWKRFECKHGWNVSAKGAVPSTGTSWRIFVCKEVLDQSTSTRILR